MRSNRASALVAALGAAATVLASGCNPVAMPYMNTPEADVVCHRYDAAIAKVRAERRYLNGEDKNVALFNLTLGVAGLEAGRLDAARDGFTRATSVMDFTTGRERGLTSMALMENVKYFKGGLHEQQLAWLLQGIAFEGLGDAESALVSYRRALDVDASSGVEELREDDALAWYLAARGFQRRGDVDAASLAMEHAAEAAPWCLACSLERSEADNLVVLVGLGEPLARVWGATAAVDAYIPRPSAAQRCEVLVDGVSVGGCSLLFDALDQIAGRDPDTRHTVQAIKGGAVGAAQPWLDRALSGRFTKLGLGQIGLADLRAVPVFPQGVGLVAAPVPPGRRRVEVVAYDGAGRPLRDHGVVFTEDVGRDGPTFRYVRLAPHRRDHARGYRCGAPNRFDYPIDDARFQAEYVKFRP